MLPAFAAAGTSFTVILIVAELEQVPFESVHFNTCVPTVKPVTCVVGLEGETIDAVPENNVQAPVPGDGTLPKIVVLPVVMQMV